MIGFLALATCSPNSNFMWHFSCNGLAPCWQALWFCTADGTTLRPWASSSFPSAVYVHCRSTHPPLKNLQNSLRAYSFCPSDVKEKFPPLFPSPPLFPGGKFTVYWRGKGREKEKGRRRRDARLGEGKDKQSPPPPSLSSSSSSSLWGMFRCSICLSLEKREMEEEKRTFWELSPSPPAVRLLLFPKSISQKRGGKLGHSHKKPVPFFQRSQTFSSMFLVMCRQCTITRLYYYSECKAFLREQRKGII